MKSAAAAISICLLLGVVLIAYVVTNYPGRTAAVILAVMALCLTGVVVAAWTALREASRER